jgi:hypothetical protein
MPFSFFEDMPTTIKSPVRKNNRTNRKEASPKLNNHVRKKGPKLTQPVLNGFILSVTGNSALVLLPGCKMI